MTAKRPFIKQGSKDILECENGYVVCDEKGDIDKTLCVPEANLRTKDGDK